MRPRETNAKNPEYAAASSSFCIKMPCMDVRGGTRRKGASTKPGAAASNPSEIPDKLMFRIGEVSRIVGVEPYVLRYWETEFPQLSPKKSGSGHRMYRRREVEQLLLIRQLLYDRQYTIKGARQYLRELGQRRQEGEEEAVAADRSRGEAALASPRGRTDGPVSPSTLPVTIDGLREELRGILAMLD